MTFLNYIMLFGLLGVAVPIVIHLLNRRQAHVVQWGAMRFLAESLASRNRRILVEELILMALRCLGVALLALAMARPFLPTRNALSWAVSLPAVLAAAILAGLAAVAWGYRTARWALLGSAAVLLATAGAVIGYEHFRQQAQWGGGGGGKDIAIVIDASDSMQLAVGDPAEADRLDSPTRPAQPAERAKLSAASAPAGRDGRGRQFERALREARGVIRAMRPADAASITLAGSVPRPVVRYPISDKQELLERLAELQPVGGSMDLPAALDAVVEPLRTGPNPAKRIIVITDSQKRNWSLSRNRRWKHVAEALKRDLPSAAELIVRPLRTPERFSNLAVSDVRVGRRVVGTDRPVTIHVTVSNTGSAPTAPRGLVLRVDGKAIDRRPVGQVRPMTSEALRFSHHFDTPGAKVLAAELEVQDDLPADDVDHRVVRVLGELPVLVVDGLLAPGQMGASSRYLVAALAPESDSSGKGPSGRNYRREVLVRPHLVSPAELAEIGDLSAWPVVVLADVPMLPQPFAERLVAHVRDGAGLWVIPGRRSLPNYYNSWTLPTGRAVMPGRLSKRFSALDARVRLDVGSFSHPVLDLAADPEESDAAAGRIWSYWQIEVSEEDPDTRVCGRLDTHTPFLAERSLGKGAVLLTAFSLDARDSSLPQRNCFVPLVHEITYYLAAPRMPASNVPAGTEVVLPLGAVAAADAVPPAGQSLLVQTPAGDANARATVVTGRDGPAVRFSATDAPGLYRVRLPGSGGSATAPTGPAVPFVVLRDADESQIAPMEAEDYDALAERLPLRRVDSADELTALVTGSVPGREIWRILVLLGIATLLGEIALSRWITIQRRSHESPTVAFGSDAIDVEGYRQRARQMVGLDTQAETPAGASS